MSFIRNLTLAGLLAIAGGLAVTAQDKPATSATTTLGDLTLSGAFSRATLPGAPVAGGFLDIRNAGAAADRLVGASADFAAKTQIHEMALVDGIMKMRELPDGLALPAGETTHLKPGGYHVMFIDLKAPLVEGTTVQVTLRFEHAGEVTLPFAVMSPGAKSMGGMAGAMPSGG